MENHENIDLLNGIEIFFDAIKEKCSSDEEYSAEILKARGFLLEDEGLVLSDNSHRNDAEYLNELLTEQNLGKVEGNKIMIFPNANVEKIFYSGIQWGSESFLEREIGWERFLHESFAPKVPLKMLEKFVGRYIKAISACGVQTHGCCDGNHTTSSNFQKLYVEISSEPNKIWHEVIFKRFLARRLVKFGRISSRGNFSFIFRKSDKWQAYIAINHVAELLYNNRKLFRKIRREVSDYILNKKDFSGEDIIEIFSSKSNELFEKYFI